MFGKMNEIMEKIQIERFELKNRIERVCEFIEDNLIDQQNEDFSRDDQLRIVISILKGESH